MKLLQEMENLGQRNHGVLPQAEAIWFIRAFADKLEGEEVVEKVAKAIHTAAFGLPYTSPNPNDVKYAKAALAVVRGMVG